MGAGADNEPLASPGNFFPGRKRRVAEFFAEFLGRSFLAFPHFAAVDHHIMRVALSLDLDLTKLDQSCFHISMFCWARAPRQETGTLRLRGALIPSRIGRSLIAVGTSPRWKRQTYSSGTARVCLSSLLSVFSSLSSMWLWKVTRCRDSRLR